MKLKKFYDLGASSFFLAKMIVKLEKTLTSNELTVMYTAHGKRRLISIRCQENVWKAN